MGAVFAEKEQMVEGREMNRVGVKNIEQCYPTQHAAMMGVFGH